MKLLCWNINSLAPTVRNCVLKWGSFKGLFEEYGADIMALQETKMRDDKLTKELTVVDGYQSFWAISRERKGYSGVATYASTAYAPLSCTADCLGSGEEDIDREGRIVVTDHHAFVLLNVYVPNAGDRPERARLDIKIRFLQALKAKADALVAQGREVIIAGDMNIAAEPKDVHPTIKYEELYTNEERGALLALLEGYTDVWRRLHPDATNVYSVWDEYTGARAFNRGLRIDYFLVTPGLLERVASCEMVPTHPKWSDHTGMVLELQDVPPIPPHPPCPEWSKLLKRFQGGGGLSALWGKQASRQQQRPQEQRPQEQRPPQQQQQQQQQQSQEAGPSEQVGPEPGASAATAAQVSQSAEEAGAPSGTTAAAEEGEGEGEGEDEGGDAAKSSRRAQQPAEGRCAGGRAAGGGGGGGSGRKRKATVQPEEQVGKGAKSGQRSIASFFAAAGSGSQ